ncbi:hypothetical protein PRUPE_8G124600 [Prunus persica]|uniref:F-box domain-containing protein n=1 Tax=Prunus persica TaxID=3760 RepID=A0A251MWZ4_PRUPE|nr:hypothetical protein PRUPE_8G124600 [Prunus persica]
MMTHGKQNSMATATIPHLPVLVIHHVLQFLPTKLAIRISYLCKQWEGLWSSVPVLDFDEEDKPDDRLQHAKFINLLDRLKRVEILPGDDNINNDRKAVGLLSLKTMSLERVMLDDMTFGRLMSGSPCLEHLSVSLIYLIIFIYRVPVSNPCKLRISILRRSE